MTERIKVRALRAGYIGNGDLGMIYRVEGDVFYLEPRVVDISVNGKVVIDPATGQKKTKTLSPADQFSERWMEIVPEEEPERITTAQDVINRETESLRAQHSQIVREPRGKRSFVAPDRATEG